MTMKKITTILLALCIPLGANSGELMAPTPMEGLEYEKELLTGNYNPDITTPSSMLGFPVGQRTATPQQIVEIVNRLAGESERALIFEYARSHEGRPLYYLVISSPENLARIDEVKADLARLADPRSHTAAEAEQIIDRLPAVAWMSYSIHGRETSGSDSALAAIYHLVASQDEDVISLLDRAIVIIDPSQNPDGRARFTKAVEEVRGTAPNVDNQSMLHTQDWPGGRYNHYLFDLNRDYIHGVHPETRGKVRAQNEWRPQMVIDAHEMSSLSSFFFSPFREPLNFNIPGFEHDWIRVFSKDQAAAFDSRQWPYFNGENYDNLYPGYTSFSSFRGAINILYEQASLSEDGVRQAGGKLVTYRESVHHQLVSTMSSLNTLADHSKDIYRDYAADRRQVVSADSPYANRSFVVLPTRNQARTDSFIATMNMQGFEVFRAASKIAVSAAVNQLGQELGRTTIPAGSIVIPNRQPEARLIAAMLEFDTGIREETLVLERQSILRRRGSYMYDVSAWNTTMWHGLEALTVPQHLSRNLEPYRQEPPDGGLVDVDNAVGWIIDGHDDRSVGFAARAMEIGLKPRVVVRDTRLDGRDYNRGSVVIARDDNRQDPESLKAEIAALASELGVTAQGFASGTGPGDLPDAGGRYFRMLEAPSVALVSHGKTNPLDVGAIWNSIDRFLGIRHSHLHQAWLERNDLRRYNVIILPDMWVPDLSPAALAGLKAWVENGGTLIAIKSSAGAVVNADAGLSSIRHIADTFKDAGQYDLALQREFLWDEERIGNMDQLWSHTTPMTVEYPWDEQEKPASEEAQKKRDQWQGLFMPKGAIAAGRVDLDHWLTFGSDSVLPVMAGNSPVLMTPVGAEAPVRYGVYLPAESQADEQNGPRKLGWATLPEGRELRLRMSGLVWPEGAQRIANSAYLAREARGNGQVILFADTPMFRGATLGTNRLLLNAIVYGPGLGARAPIVP